MAGPSRMSSIAVIADSGRMPGWADATLDSFRGD